MQIIVVGCGKVGRTLVEQLSGEDHNVTVVDTRADVIRSVSLQYDVMGIVGNGTSYQVLEEADLEHTDILIAVTQSDEVNLLCCVMAKKKADCHTIARVRNPIYSEERDFLQKELELSMTINPELEAAREMARLLQFPNAIEIERFAKGRIELLSFRVPENSKLEGVALRDIPSRLSQSLLICMARRNGQVIIPDGSFVVQKGDILTIVSEISQAQKLFDAIGVRTNKVKNTLIIGGGDTSYYLTKLLERSGIGVKIVEKNRKRCEELSELFPFATIDCGDGSNQELLDEERLETLDSLVACTGIDEVNAILSLYAKKKVRTKVITKLNRIEFNDVVRELDLDSVIKPKSLTAYRILQYVRAMHNSQDSNVETLYKLVDGQVEALEFLIRGESDVTGITLAEMRLKKNVLIAGITRNGRLIIPGGQDTFQAGDSVIVVTTNIGFHDIHDILLGAEA